MDTKTMTIWTFAIWQVVDIVLEQIIDSPPVFHGVLRRSVERSLAIGWPQVAYCFVDCACRYGERAPNEFHRYTSVKSSDGYMTAPALRRPKISGGQHL